MKVAKSYLFLITLTNITVGKNLLESHERKDPYYFNDAILSNVNCYQFLRAGIVDGTDEQEQTRLTTENLCFSTCVASFSFVSSTAHFCMYDYDTCYDLRSI